MKQFNNDQFDSYHFSDCGAQTKLHQQNTNNSEKIWALGMFDIHIYLAVKIRSWGPPAGIFQITIHHIIMSHLFIRWPGRKRNKRSENNLPFLTKTQVSDREVTVFFYYFSLLQWRWGILVIFKFAVGHIPSTVFPTYQNLEIALGKACHFILTFFVSPSFATHCLWKGILEPGDTSSG